MQEGRIYLRWGSYTLRIICLKYSSYFISWNFGDLWGSIVWELRIFSILELFYGRIFTIQFPIACKLSIQHKSISNPKNKTHKIPQFPKSQKITPIINAHNNINYNNSQHYRQQVRRQMRTYLKNDLFFFSGIIQSQNQKNNKLKQAQKNQSQQPPSSNTHNESPLKLTNFNAEQALKIQVHNKKDDVDIDDQLKQVFATMKSQKKAKNKEMTPLRAICTPKCTLKEIEVKNQTDKVNLSSKEQFILDRKQKQQMWRMRKQLTKVIKTEIQQQPDKQKAEMQKNNDGLQKKKEEGQEQKQSSDQQKQQQIAKAKTGKKKKIKKQVNLVKTDLKRKYRDRFVGGLNRNLRMLTKGGKMKRAYHKNNLQSELQLDEGELYNSYVISLSKALFVTIDLDEDGSIEESRELCYTVPQTYERQNMQKLIQELFGFSSFREGQYQTTLNILEGRSTFFISETASGKSLTYVLASVILKGLSIVVSPLVSLMLDQIEHLPSDLPAACISSLLNYDQRDRILKMVKEGKIQLLYITPESFLTDFMYHVREFPPINFVCIDEAHSMSELSHSFRASYLSLEDIILKYFKYKTTQPVVLCLTATANIETVESVSEKLNIKQIIRSKSVINKNLFVTISRQNLTAKYQGVVQYLNHPQIRKCKGILVYCRTKRIMFDVFNYLRNSSLLCYIYHSGLPQKEKVETLEKFRKGVIRIVIATVALGMGLDFENLECVVHINMPKSVENFIQEIGRAGRRQKRAYCHLFLDKFDYFTQRNYFLADQLQPRMFESIIEILKTNFFETRRKSRYMNKIAKVDQTQSLKRLTLQDKYAGEQKEKQKIDNQIYQEQEEDEQNQKKQDQPQKKDKAENIPADIVQESNKEEQCEEQQEEELNGLEIDFLPLSYCKADYITEKVGLKQQAILNILLKIQKNLTRKIFKVLPMSYQTLKISFFKKNEDLIKKQSEFYPTLVSNCKLVKGTIYVPLILKCNQLKMSPIRLLSEVYGISNKYCLKIELINQVFVWQHQKSVKHTFEILSRKQVFEKVMEDFNMVQRTSLTKFNIFYSLCFNHSSKNIIHILQKNQIVSDKDPLPTNSILNSFDKYFKEQTYEFYREITKQGEAQGQQQQDTENKEVEAAYLPITHISESDQTDVKQSVDLFLKHVILNNPEKKFMPTIAPYRDGRLITRVFMGVNDTNSNWKIYGEHPYWMKFVDKDYRQLLRTVRRCITEYVAVQGLRIVNQEDKKGLKNSKKQ